jgi:hypothetical protein
VAGDEEVCAVLVEAGATAACLSEALCLGDMALMTVPAVQESVSALWAAVQEAPRPCDTRALLARAEAAISACFHVAAPRLASATALSWSAVDGAAGWPSAVRYVVQQKLGAGGAWAEVARAAAGEARAAVADVFSHGAGSFPLFRVAALNRAGRGLWSKELDITRCFRFEHVEQPKRRGECGAFDERGVLFHLGTKGGTQPYANPHGGDSGVVASMSSVASGSSNPKKLTEHRHGSAVWNNTKSKPGQWVAVDLGASHRLVLDHDALRNDNDSRNYLCSWILEASNDADTWQPLREHKNDASLVGSMAVAAWALDGAAVGGRSFRHFRVRQTGKNAAGDDALHCAGIELYGRLATSE